MSVLSGSDAIVRLNNCVQSLCKTQQNFKSSFSLGNSCCDSPICVRVSGTYPYEFENGTTGAAVFFATQVTNSLATATTQIGFTTMTILEGTGCTNYYYRVSANTYNRLGLLSETNQLSTSTVNPYIIVMNDKFGNVITATVNTSTFFTDGLFFQVLPNCMLTGPFLATGN